MGWKESAVPAIAAAVSGLVGVIVGAVVSGHYQLESQRLVIQQSENTAQYEASRLAGQALVSDAADYLAELGQLAVLARTPEKVVDLDGGLKTLYHHSFKLSLQTTIPTGQKIFDANVYVAEVMAAAHDPEKLEALAGKKKLLGEVYLAVYMDIARYRITSGPTFGRDELMTSLVQLLTETPEPSE